MNGAKVWVEQITIPTYEIGEAEKNPIFLDKRVYQGSSGKVYPYPTVEKISEKKTDKEYTAVWLENEYLKVMVLPELGGRIQRAYDKTNDYDFVYYNHVIKPALVGLTGPWISGGIEFNWPQHHRPTTFLPVDYTTLENEDGTVQKNFVLNADGSGAAFAPEYDSSNNYAPVHFLTFGYAGNTAPTVAPNAITTANVAVGTEWTLDLADVFVDADGDTLTYTATINDAAQTLNGSILTYTPAAAGTYLL